MLLEKSAFFGMFTHRNIILLYKIYNNTLAYHINCFLAIKLYIMFVGKLDVTDLKLFYVALTY